MSDLLPEPIDRTHGMANNGADYEYVVGGSLPRDAQSYVVRQADEIFYQRLLAGEFCYVLNARQMGKSSLRVRTMERLQAAGVICAPIDITAIGAEEITREEWYLGVVRAILRAMGRSMPALKQFDLNAWWADRDGISFVQRWSEFVEDVLLVEVAQPIVIFVDEIDSLLGLGVGDDFFAAIRECYNRRVDQAEYKRLTFALLGVSTPQDLMKDTRRTPFNVGGAIELAGFSVAEARALAVGLPGGETQLAEVIAWTGGQPFLTQKICNLVRDGAIAVETVVRDGVIEGWEGKDEPVHLRSIQDRVMANESLAGAILGVYQQILKDGSVKFDGSVEQLALQLAGMVVKGGDRLVIANRIYGAVFDRAWVAAKLAALRPYGEELQKWLDTGKEAWLLKGDRLEEAQAWANEKNRKLAPEDYRFIQASVKNILKESASELKEIIYMTQELDKKSRKKYETMQGTYESLIASMTSANGVAEKLIAIQQDQINLSAEENKALLRENELLADFHSAAIKIVESLREENHLYSKQIDNLNQLSFRGRDSVLEFLRIREDREDINSEALKSLRQFFSLLREEIQTEEIRTKRSKLFSTIVIFFLSALLIFSRFTAP
jgi:hypothetical protein